MSSPVHEADGRRPFRDTDQSKRAMKKCEGTVISNRHLFHLPIVFCVLLASTVTGRPAFAQTFGRNKVQYENFRFKILETANFDLYHYGEASDAARLAAPMLERWRFRLESFFGYPLPQNQPVVLYANHPDFQQTNIIPGTISQGIGGVTESGRNRIVVPLTGVNAENDHVLGHELVHAFHFSAPVLEGRIDQSTVPLWFSEGLAEYLSLGRRSELTAVWLRDAVLTDDLPTISALSYSMVHSPYRFGHAVWAYIAGRWGDRAAAEYFEKALAYGTRIAAADALGIGEENLSAAWHREVRAWADRLFESRSFDAVPGRRIPTGADGMNLGPAVSPDGVFTAYFSRNEVFSLDLVIAETASGKVVRKIANGSTDRHYDELRFMNSAGTWSPDSKLFAFITVREGDDGIAIVSAESGAYERTIRIPGIQAISHLAWSPDGNSIAFSGIAGGVSDLYLYGLEDGSLVKLTDDPYSDLQPDWSPDGTQLVFVSDRGEGTDFERYLFGPMGLASIDLSTGEIGTMRFSADTDHVSPQFAPDGRSVYFTASLDGVPDVYRYFPATGLLYRVTRVKTGVIGLTGLSPALSVADRTGELVFNLFENKGYGIYTRPQTEPDDADEVTGAEILGVEGPVWAFAADEVVRLPSPDRTGTVDAYLDDPELGLPADLEYETADYRPALSLANIGDVSIGIMISGGQTTVFGNVLLLFDDFLSNHLLLTAFSVNGEILKDFSAQAMYINRERRLNWGLSVEHTPERYVSFTGDDPPESEDEEFELTRTTRRVYTDGAAFLTEFPFSQNRRLEAAAGYSFVRFDLEREAFRIADGRVVSSRAVPAENPSPLHLVRMPISYVGDYSYFGFTAPFAGRRFRFGLEPVFGSLNYLSVSADFRRYLFMNPMSLAFRFLHHGRYLGDSESGMLTPLFLGANGLVRGYGPSLFSVPYCTDGTARPEFDSISGTRIGVFNAELRLALVGNRDLGLIDFPYLPVTLAAFFDAGVAWKRDELPVFGLPGTSPDRGHRIPVYSVGGSLSVNFLGAFVAQLYYVYPFQRPDRGAHFDLSIGAGF